MNSEKSIDDLSINNSKFLPKSSLVPDTCSFNKIKSITSDKATLTIRKYETGFVSLFIVLLKLNKSTVIKIDAIIGIPGINQVKFKIIILNQA